MARNDVKLFAPGNFSVRDPLDNNRVKGRIINPPRIAQLGGMTKSNADQREPTLRLKKPKDTV